MPMPMPRVSPLPRKELKPWTGPAADFALGAPFSQAQLQAVKLTAAGGLSILLHGGPSLLASRACDPWQKLSMLRRAWCCGILLAACGSLRGRPPVPNPELGTLHSNQNRRHH